MRRLLAVVALLLGSAGLGLVADVGTARPASAHATVVTTSPAQDARLARAPDRVTLRFDETVSLGSGYARVLGPGGSRVDADQATVRDSTVTVPLRAGSGEGSYVVTWRVVSADSHPVSGAYAFVVGQGRLVPAGADAPGSGTDPVVGVALPLARGLGYAGLALAVGVPALLAFAWPAGWALRRMRRLTVGGLGAVGVAALASFALQGPYAAGRGPGSLLDPTLLSTTAGSSYGVTLLLRAVLAAVLAAVLVPAWSRARQPALPVLGAAGVLAAGLVLATAAVGHPVAGARPGLAVAVAAVHVLAMAVWLGGLVAVVAGLLRGGVPAGQLRRALPRFSRVAFASVAALVATGVLQSVREVGSVDGLVSSAYGRLLLVKLALVAAVLAGAAVSRVWVQQHVGGHRPHAPLGRVTAHAFAATDRDGGRAPTAEGPSNGEAADAPADDLPVADPRPFRRSVLAELLLAGAVLAVSAVLVGTAPATAAAGHPVAVTLPLQSSSGSGGSGTVEVSVAPAAVGANTVDVYLLDARGRLAQPRAIDVTLTEPAQQIGPLPVELHPAGPGHWTAEPSIPTAGRWTLTVTVRLDEFTAATAGTTFPAS